MTKKEYNRQFDMVIQAAKAGVLPRELALDLILKLLEEFGKGGI